MSLCRCDRIFRQNQDLSDNLTSTQQANICSFCRKKGVSATLARTFVLKHGGGSLHFSNSYHYHKPSKLFYSPDTLKFQSTPIHLTPLPSTHPTTPLSTSTTTPITHQKSPISTPIPIRFFSST